MYLITACFSLIRPSSCVYTHAKIVAPSCECIFFLILKTLKFLNKIADSATLLLVVLFVAVVCGYQLPAELICSVWIQNMNHVVDSGVTHRLKVLFWTFPINYVYENEAMGKEPSLLSPMDVCGLTVVMFANEGIGYTSN